MQPLTQCRRTRLDSLSRVCYDSITMKKTLSRSGLFLCLLLFLLPTAKAADKAALLPAGYLNVRGNQIVGPDGKAVRIASVGGFGTVIVGGRLEYSGHYSGPYKGLDANLAAVKKMGFNCIRVDFTNKSVEDTVLMTQFDELVAGCKKFGLKVIFDNHNNEATPASWDNAAQQSNGLWFDVGPGTDGTDGAKDKGTISREKFQEDWVTMARHWAHNPTVIGFDLRNEPCAHTATPALWGGNGPTDIHAMYEERRQCRFGGQSRCA